MKAMLELLRRLIINGLIARTTAISYRPIPRGKPQDGKR